VSLEVAWAYEGSWHCEGVKLMGERSKGKDKGKAKKKPKAVKPGNRPHEQQQQAQALTMPRQTGLPRPPAQDD
jgi:hypothetical protein